MSDREDFDCGCWIDLSVTPHVVNECYKHSKQIEDARLAAAPHVMTWKKHLKRQAEILADLSAATSRLAAVEKENVGYQKANHLLQKGMESVTELYDGQKHEIRDLTANIAAAESSRDEMREALREIATHGDDDHECGHSQIVYCIGDIKRRAHALVSRAESDAGEAVTFDAYRFVVRCLVRGRELLYETDPHNAMLIEVSKPLVDELRTALGIKAN